VAAGAGVDETMRNTPVARADLLEVVRVLLLLQGAILVANTIEAGLFAVAFSAGVVPSVLATAVAAVAIFIGRARLGRGGRRSLRAIYIVEGVIIVMLALDLTLALVLTHQTVPAMAVLTRFALPVAVIALLGQIERAGQRGATFSEAA
jgi:uncharacterized membrane-anchored protein